MLTVRGPHTDKWHIDKIEKVQMRATKMVQQLRKYSYESHVWMAESAYFKIQKIERRHDSGV